MDTQKIIKSWKWRIVRAGHNQATFAEKAGVDSPSLGAYMAGKKNPSLKTFEKIEKALVEIEDHS